MVRQALSLVFEALKARVATFLKKEKAKGRVVRTARTQQLTEFYVASVQEAVLYRYSYVRLTIPNPWRNAWCLWCLFEAEIGSTQAKQLKQWKQARP